MRVCSLEYACVCVCVFSLETFGKQKLDGKTKVRHIGWNVPGTKPNSKLRLKIKQPANINHAPHLDPL